MKLYDYQKKTVDYVIGELMFGENKLLIESPISSGKTAIMASIAMEITGSVVISLSISDLIPQFEQTFKMLGFDDFTIIKSGMDYNPDKRVIVAMEQTLIQRLHLIKDKQIELMLIEEAHIRYQGSRFKGILEALNPLGECYFTGTALSSYNTQMNGFNSKYTTISINKLIADGKLAKPQYIVPMWSREEQYSPGSKIGKEFTNEELAVQQTQEFINKTVDSYMEHFDKNTKSIWFCSSIEMSLKYEEELQKRGVIAFCYHGKMKKDLSETVLGSFKNNEPVLFDRDINLFNYQEEHEPVTVRALISINKLAVGFSVSDVEVAVRTSSTAILSRSLQIDGRAIRKHEGKKYGYIMDVAQNIMRLGMITDEYEPLPYGTDIKTVKHDIRNKLSMPYIELIDNDFVSREAYNAKISSILNDNRRYSQRSINELKQAFMVETDPMKIIAIGLAFMDKVHCEPMKNKWGKEDRGYVTMSYDKILGKEVEKEIVGFYNQKTLKWIAEPFVELIEEHKDNEVLIEKWIKAMKTKIRSVVNKRLNVYTLRFFPDFLKKKKLETELSEGWFYLDHENKVGYIYDSITETTHENVSFKEYHKMKDEYELSWTIEPTKTTKVDYSDDFDIEIDEELPF
jgi:superfamily II DNA or RNA helicase